MIASAALTLVLAVTPAAPPTTTTTTTSSTAPVSLPSSWAPPLTGDDSGFFAAAQLFTALEAPLSPAQQQVWPRFTIERAEFGGGFVHERWLQAVVRLEAVRSASPQSAFGIDGNSLLPRFRLAYGAVTPSFTVPVVGVDIEVVARGGLIPEPWLERLEARSATRGLLPLPGERAGVIGTSDLGASVSASLNHGLVDVVVAVTNGEGKTDEERNAGKTIEAVVGTTPVVLDVFGEPLSLAAHAGWRDGSVGVSSTRAHRGLFALTASHPWFHIGGEGVYALGVDDRGDREVAVVGVFADAPIVPGWLGAVARYDLVADVAVRAAADARTHAVLGGLFCDFGHPEVVGRTAGSMLRRLRLYATAEARHAEAGAIVVGSSDAADSVRLLLTLEATGVSDLFNPWRSVSPTP